MSEVRSMTHVNYFFIYKMGAQLFSSHVTEESFSCQINSFSLMDLKAASLHFLLSGTVCTVNV